MIQILNQQDDWYQLQILGTHDWTSFNYNGIKERLFV